MDTTTNAGNPETGREQQTDQQHEEEREVSRPSTPTEAPMAEQDDEPTSSPPNAISSSPRQASEQHEHVRASTPELPHHEEHHPREHSQDEHLHEDAAQQDHSSVAPPSSPPVSRSPSPQPHDLSTITELPPTNTHLHPEPHTRPQSAASSQRSHRSHPPTSRMQTHSRTNSRSSAHRPSSRQSGKSREDRGPMDLEGRQRAKTEEAKEARWNREQEVKKKMMWTGMGEKPQGW